MSILDDKEIQEGVVSLFKITEQLTAKMEVPISVDGTVPQKFFLNLLGSLRVHTALLQQQQLISNILFTELLDKLTELDQQDVKQNMVSALAKIVKELETKQEAKPKILTPNNRRFKL